MNIFLLDKNPQVCASYHCDKHVIKMILETAQLLSTAHRLLDGKESIERINNRNYKRWILNDDRDSVIYKSTHINHPSAKWVRLNKQNYLFAYNLFVELSLEFKERFNKDHLSFVKLKDILKYTPSNLVKDSTIFSMTKEYQAMPLEYKNIDPIVAYRNYYKKTKNHLFTWKNKKIPEWINND